MGLSALDLASRFTGWFSLGCSIWSAIPQILLLLRLPSRGGPSFSLLIAWLLGDAALVAGMYLTHAPVTQKFSGIWFGMGDIIIMLLLLLGRSSLGKRYRDRRHSWDSDHSHSVTLVTKREARKRWWKEADSWPLNALVGGVLTIGTVLVWYVVDVRNRAKTPPLEPIKAPFDGISWAGWAIGFAGLLCYNIPRWYQIYKIRRNRSMENISLFMFAWLLAQNVTMLASILTVSHSPGAIFGQAPFIANAILALLADIVIIRLYRRYGDSGKFARSPSQVPEPTQAGLQSADSVYVLPEVDVGDSQEQIRGAYEKAAQLTFHQHLELLEEEWQRSLRQEEAFHANQALLPWMARKEKNVALDQRAYDEKQRLQDLDDLRSASETQDSAGGPTSYHALPATP
ncbi:hypothetical protein B0A53_01699 [Rhodotorula sp. CCFEE 5036]|nr:hypothetical protein B0A53_01699 [Rhodotorula sp. CCFEE 5036]